MSPDNVPDGVLVLALLTVESSYLANVERVATSAEDTVQFWLGSAGPWRIRTYAIDHDIHVHSLGSMDQALAQELIAKRYADVVSKQLVISFKNLEDADEVRRTLQAAGLNGTLEVAPHGFAFYNPDGETYATQSEPE